MDGLVDDPALLAGELEDEDVVDVVVRGEPARRRGRDVRVDLDRVPELAGQRSGEVDDRRPEPMERLQHDRRAVGEEARDRGVVDLVADRRADPAGPRVPAAVDDDAVLRHPEERRAEAAARQELVDSVEVEQVVERPRQLARRREQRAADPMRPRTPSGSATQRARARPSCAGPVGRRGTCGTALIDRR